MTNVREIKRRQRIDATKGLIERAQKKGADVDQDKLIATLCIEFGVSRRTAMEYITTLVNSGTVKL